MLRSIGDSMVPAVGLGCMGLSEFYGQTPKEKALQILHTAVDIGYRHFDTADMYGRGENENLIGDFLCEQKSRRDKLFIATKCGIIRDPEKKYSISLNGSADYIRAACDASLKRLKTEYIDLYYLHRVDPKTPLEESLGAMTDLIKEGKIKYIGLSEASLEQLQQAHKIVPITAVQNEMSLWTRDSEQGILPFCETAGIAFVAFSPLGRGFLSGNINQGYMSQLNSELDFRTKLPRFNAENLPQNTQLVEQMKTIADGLKISPSDLALAWVLAKSKSIHIIPGTKTERYLTSNFASGEISLSSETITNLDRIFFPGAAAGSRYPQ